MKTFIDGQFKLKKMMVNDYQSILLIFSFIAVNDLLVKSVIPYRGFHLKFKRTNPIIDSKSFILQSRIDVRKGLIPLEKFSSYIEILIDRSSFKLTDLSSPLEQILLVQCDKIISRNSFSTFVANTNTYF
jgi:hypothetical protein